MKNLFDKAKKTPSKTTKATNDKVRVNPDMEDFYESIEELEELKAKEKSLKAKIGMLTNEIKTVGTDEFVKLYGETGRCPGSFMLESVEGENTAQIMFVPTDRYIKIDEDQANDLTEEFGDDIITEGTSYGFNKKLLEKYSEEISEAIMNSDIPQKDKEKIITASTTYSVAKGTIEKMADYGNIEEVMEKVRPVIQLKGAEIIKG
jgi:hypothetical protein